VVERLGAASQEHPALSTAGLRSAYGVPFGKGMPVPVVSELTQQISEGQAMSDRFEPSINARDRVEAALLGSGLPPQNAADESDSELIAELAAAEALALTLADRLRAAVGMAVVLTLNTQDHTAQRMRGTVERSSADHVVLRVEFGLVVIPTNVLVSVGGLGQGARRDTTVGTAWTWRSTMRRWLGDEVVVYQTTAGNVRGELERVAADHIDLRTVAGSLTITWSGVVAVLNHHAHDADADAALDA
jgi:hypothetical protein